jgi:hypothetical protein
MRVMRLYPDNAGIAFLISRTTNAAAVAPAHRRAALIISIDARVLERWNSGKREFSPVIGENARIPESENS